MGFEPFEPSINSARRALAAAIPLIRAIVRSVEGSARRSSGKHGPEQGDADRADAAGDHRRDRADQGGEEARFGLAELVRGGDERAARPRRPGRASRPACRAGSATGGRRPRTCRPRRARTRQASDSGIQRRQAEHDRRDPEHGRPRRASWRRHCASAAGRRTRARSASRRPRARRADGRARPARHGGCRGRRPAASRSRRRAGPRTDRARSRRAPAGCRGHRRGRRSSARIGWRAPVDRRPRHRPDQEHAERATRRTAGPRRYRAGCGDPGVEIAAERRPGDHARLPGDRAQRDRAGQDLARHQVGRQRAAAPARRRRGRRRAGRRPRTEDAESIVAGPGQPGERGGAEHLERDGGAGDRSAGRPGRRPSR